jgi:hypothetical protein
VFDFDPLFKLDAVIATKLHPLIALSEYSLMVDSTISDSPHLAHADVLPLPSTATPLPP